MTEWQVVIVAVASAVSAAVTWAVRGKRGPPPVIDAGRIAGAVRETLKEELSALRRELVLEVRYQGDQIRSEMCSKLTASQAEIELAIVTAALKGRQP